MLKSMLRLISPSLGSHLTMKGRYANEVRYTFQRVGESSLD